MNACGIEIIRDSQSFDALREEWTKISAPRILDNPFLSHAWNRVCAANGGEGTELNVIVLRDDGGKAQAIAPLAVETEKAGPFRFRRLCFIGEGVSDYHDFVARDDDPALLAALWREALKGSSRWDRAKLCDFPAASPSLAVLRDLGTTAEIRRASPCPKMEIPPSWDELTARLPARLVKDAAYQERRLEREGRLEHRELRDEAELPAFLEALFRLHEKRWARTPTPSKFLKERARRRAGELALAMLKAGYAAYSTLLLDGKPIAAHFGFSSATTLYYYVPAYDPEYERLSIGRTLYFRVLRSALDRGLTRFDFLRGGEEYKLRWGGSEAYNYEALAWRPGAGAAACAALEAYRRLRGPR
ncbi:MAG TPA: GNAT family N-acetyltransferase [Spirochaetales bacterium]|nr:GNAT family N-acetyltransferase [Spirochaetales bacterium]